MKYNHYLGIDISKNKLDVCVFDGNNILIHLVCKNDVVTIEKLFKGLLDDNIEFDKVLVCAEHTGLYSFSLIESCESLNIDLWLENPAEIKLSSGVQRGKNDKIDAERIANYACRYKDKANLYTNNKNIEEIKNLTSERGLYVVDRAKYKGQIKSQKGHMPNQYYKSKTVRLKKLITTLSKQIVQIENLIDELIVKNDELKRQYELITTVNGVGKQVAIQTIVSTVGFTKFNNPRKFACHVGVAPFAYLSGSSQRTRWKVSHRANKDLKNIFHMAALSALRMEGEFRDYYLRKVEEGKNKMTVINAIRAKIIHRIFAVIRDNKKYDKNYINSLDLSIR